MERISKTTGGWIFPTAQKEIIKLSKDDIFDVFRLLRKKFPQQSKAYYSKNPNNGEVTFSMQASWNFTDQTFSKAVFEFFDIKVENITNLHISWYSNEDQRGCEITYNVGNK